MTCLTKDQLEALIAFVGENNQYNTDDDQITYWNGILDALTLEYRMHYD